MGGTKIDKFLNITGEKPMLRFLPFLGILCTFVSFPVQGWVALPPTPTSFRYLENISQEAQAVYILDVNSQSILYQKKAHDFFNPASMTKIVVLDMAYDYIKENQISLEDIIPISAAADYRNSPPDSSLMFLQEGQRVTLSEILKGIAIPSGNDATVAFAEFMAGSEKDFIDQMNAHVRELGFMDMFFVDTSGYSAQNFVSAEDMTLFTYQYLQKHPETLGELHNLREFTYPETQHGGNTDLPFNIRQENKNYLLGQYPGADGVKTGHIDEIGYNLMGTAQRDGRRIIVCVIGIPGSTGEEGARKRAVLASRLLDYAFDEYQEILLPHKVGVIPLLGGKQENTPLLLGTPTYLLFPKEEEGLLHSVIHLKDNLTSLSAPIFERREVGSVSFSFKGKILKEVPLYVNPEESAGWFKWFKDYLRIFFASLWGKKE